MRCFDIPIESKPDYFKARDIAEASGEVVGTAGIYPDLRFFPISVSDADAIDVETVTEY